MYPDSRIAALFRCHLLPPQPSHGLTGLIELIERIKDVWKGEERERIEEQAEHIVKVLNENLHTTGKNFPQKDQAIRAAELLFKMADPQYGGIRGVPKFPIGYQWSFLLHYGWLTGDSRALFLNGAHSRYDAEGRHLRPFGRGIFPLLVDDKWLVPHFEKMLYDNALLAFSYLEAWQVTQKPLYRTICESILNMSYAT